MTTCPFFAPCPAKLEDLLAAELQSLAETRPGLIARIEPGHSGVSFEGSVEALYRVCLGTRIASRLLLKLGEAPAADPEQLYEAARGLPWGDHFTPAQTIAVRATGIVEPRDGHAGLENPRFTALKIKDAVADAFRDAAGKRPSVDTDDPDIRLEARLEKGQAIFYLNLGGESLSRRGYRERTTTAPLRENTAAAVLLRAGWPQIAAAGGALVDPLCGSGTLLIEGALIAAGVPANLLRSRFGFSSWKFHQPELFREIREEALALWKERKETLPPILGFDRDPLALKAARINLQRAGLNGIVRVETAELADMTEEMIPAEPGLVCANPPYGKRLEENRELEPLYRLIGQKMRTTFAGWHLGLITSESSLIQATGLKVTETRRTRNGELKAHIAVVPPDQPDPLESLTQSGEQFLNRLKKNRKERRKKARRQGVTCYRLYDADLPDYNAAIDLYTDTEGVTRAVVQEYAPPVRIDEGKMNRRLRELMTGLTETLELSPTQIFLKKRRRQRGSSQYTPEKGRAGEGETALIEEQGCRFRVNFTGSIDTGIFLDHRPLRCRIQEEAAGKRFLNLFAYTGTTTVHAARGGAAATVSVDTSRTYLDWAQENLRLNQITGNHRFERHDVMRYLAVCQDRFDLIMLDPPTFSNSKNREEVFDVQKDHPQLLDMVWELLAPGGTLFFSCNFRKFKLEWQPPEGEGHSIREITKATIGFDFERNPKIHYCWEIRKEL